MGCWTRRADSPGTIGGGAALRPRAGRSAPTRGTSKVTAMADVTVYHNPNCGSSKNALALLDELGVDYEVVLYLKTPPARPTLERIVAGLDGPVEDLVRKDSRFEKLGLDPESYVGRPEAVVELLSREKALMQRPLLVRGDKAVIGRPKERIPDFVA